MLYICPQATHAFSKGTFTALISVLPPSNHLKATLFIALGLIGLTQFLLEIVMTSFQSIWTLMNNILQKTLQKIGKFCYTIIEDLQWLQTVNKETVHLL